MPKLTDAELLTVAVMQALLGYVLRGPLAAPCPHPPARPVPYLPGQSGSNKRLRACFPLLRYFIRVLASDTDLWADPCGSSPTPPRSNAPRSRATVRRSALAGWAAYGYCRSHTRWFWGLRLHLVCTLLGLPVAFALANPKADERQVRLDLLAVEPELVAARPGLLILADKGYRDAHTKAALTSQRAMLLRPAFKREPPRAGQRRCGHCGS